MTSKMSNPTMMLFFCFLLQDRVQALTTANDFIDDVLKSSLQFEAINVHLDPLAIPDFKTDFQDYVSLIGLVKGHVDYTNGELEGLSNVHRNTNCTGPIYGFTAAVINCSIALDNLHISYKGKVKYGKLPSLAISAKATMSKTILYVDAVSFPQSLMPVMRSFRFLQIGSVDTKFSGLGAPLNKYLGVLDAKFREQVWAVFFNAIGQEFRFALSRAISRVPLALPPVK